MSTQKPLPDSEKNSAAKLQISSAEVLLEDILLASNSARATVWQPMQKHLGLSEGKFRLLLTLKRAGCEMSVGMLARRLGVTDATTSIMVSRMLKQKTPLVKRCACGLDGRAAMIRLTARGESLLTTALEKYRNASSQFSQALSEAERRLLASLLEKLSTQRR